MSLTCLALIIFLGSKPGHNAKSRSLVKAFAKSVVRILASDDRHETHTGAQ